MVRFLFIDPEREILTAVKELLELENDQLEVCTCFTISEGLKVFEAQCAKFNLIALDIQWRDRGPCELLTRFRRQTASPIIVVSAIIEDEKIIRAYESGADHFIPKPARITVMKAFFEAQLRQAILYSDPVMEIRKESPMEFHGGLEIDPGRRIAIRNDQIINLTAREFDLLNYIARNADIVLSPEQIADNVAGYDNVNNRSLYSHMSRLRKKITPNSDCPSYIFTNHGQGYVFKSK